MTDYLKNKGNTVVEATIILPFFIFGMLTFFHMGKAKLTEQIVYEAAIETAEYLAEEAYLEIYNPITPYVRFREYVDDAGLVERYVHNGINGILISGYSEPDENNQITITVQFATNVFVPFFRPLTANHTYKITQQVYLGDQGSEKQEYSENEQYVFVTDNRDVYHVSRNCSHLLLSIHSASIQDIGKSYTPCEFCGKDKIRDVVFITDDGNRYHCSLNCSGLKRTVYRVKKSAVGGLPECSRCVN